MLIFAQIPVQFYLLFHPIWKKKWWFTPTFCCLPFGWVFYPICKFYPITAKPFKSLLRVWWSLLLKSRSEIWLSLSRCGHLAHPNIPKDLWGRHDISLWKIMLTFLWHTILLPIPLILVFIILSTNLFNTCIDLTGSQSSKFLLETFRCWITDFIFFFFYFLLSLY